MSVVIILILASLAVGLVFVGAFVWSVRSGQYEDTLTPSMRVLLDDAEPQVQPPPAVVAAALLPTEAEKQTTPDRADRKTTI
jgi:cbb3-type cytochrome oxidase maturation protein